VGSIAVLRDGRVARRVDLVTAAEVPGAGPLRVIADELGLLMGLLALGAGGGALVLAARVRARRRRDAERAAKRKARRSAEAPTET